MWVLPPDCSRYEHQPAAITQSSEDFENDKIFFDIITEKGIKNNNEMPVT